MLAWVAHNTDDDGDSHYVVFADTRGDAKQAGHAAVSSDWPCDWTSVRVKRAPEWDGREKNPPTRAELFKSGWTFQCSSCEAHVDVDVEAPGGWDDEGDEPVCTTCATRAKEKRA
jgi:hypothetical protein